MSEEASEPNKPVEKKKGKGKLVGILVALALILGAGAAGAVLAPKYLGGGEKPAHKPAEGEEEAGAEEGSA
jgi:flagellar basal body-associated protein FliL